MRKIQFIITEKKNKVTETNNFERSLEHQSLAFERVRNTTQFGPIFILDPHPVPVHL